MSEAPAQKRVRRAARIIILDPDDRTLLFRFDVEGRPPFWVTTGGECDPDESFDDAALRELFEETGIVADPGSEIARIEPEFVTVEGEPVQADERYYFLRVENAEIDTSRHTDLEQKLMTRHRWFTLEEMADWHEAIYPEILAEIIVENML